MRVYGRVRYSSAYTDVSSNKFHIISANKLNKSIGRHKVNDKSIQKQTIVSFLFKKCCSDRAEAPIEDGSQSSSNRKVTPSQAARIAKTATHGALKAQRPYSIGQGPSALSPKGASRLPEGWRCRASRHRSGGAKSSPTQIFPP